MHLYINTRDYLGDLSELLAQILNWVLLYSKREVRVAYHENISKLNYS